MNISFSMTTAQMRDRTKTVTRRLGWANLKPGMIVTAIEKGQGLKKGEKIKPIHQIRIVSIKNQTLSHLLNCDPVYGIDEMWREGFPHFTPTEFVEMFCAANGCKPSIQVNRIEFEHL